MLIDLLSTSNYVSYNIQLAELFGLHSAIYISELMNINDKAIRKNKVDANYFKLQRDYIKSRTTLDEKEQMAIEDNLIKIGVLERKSQNELSLNITTLTTIMMSPDETLLEDIKSITKKPRKSKRVTKAEAIKENLKASIITDNEELREAYSCWIDAVYTKDGWMTVDAVQAAQEVIDNASNRDLDIALSILKIARINAYRDMTWAVNYYQKQNNINYRVKNTKSYNNPTPINDNKPVKLSSEVF